MVLQRSASGFASRTMRVLGFAVAYTFVLVTGTAMLMAAMGSPDTGRQAETVAQQPTAIELAPEAFLLASRNIPNDKRGF
jgi:hypothetical protein